MNELKKDIFLRLKNKENQFLFSTFSGINYSSKDVLNYYFFILKGISKLDFQNIVLICNSSIESHVLSLFFVLSEFNITLLNKDSIENLNWIKKPVIISLNLQTHEKLKYTSKKELLYLAPTLDKFLKYTHPSFDLNELTISYFSNTKVGKTIFLSSGSTGTPKVIPLTYEQINSCYLNVFDGFLADLSFQNILSVHDTSFVIILPFIFCLASNKKANLIASDSNSLTNPIIKLSGSIHTFKNFIIISVPSVFRFLSNLLKDKFEKFVISENFISCGEPLDKKLALKIYSCEPKSFLNLYGSTEVSPWILWLNVIDFINTHKNKNNLPAVLPVGKSLPSTELKLSMDSELLVYSNSLFSGYLNQDNKKHFKDFKGKLFFKTGDIFELIDNQFYCRGRLNNSLKMAGIFINPILLELEIKDILELDNVLILPDTTKIIIKIIIFSDKIDKELMKDLKIIITKDTLKSIPKEIIFDGENIEYLQSGKINRNFYKNKYIS